MNHTHTFGADTLSSAPRRIVFVSLQKEFLDDVVRAVQSKPKCLEILHVETCTDVQDTRYEMEHGGGVAYVSPANSLGFMDSGIDFVYSRRMFPGVEREVRRRIHELDIRTTLGRAFLPIGSALLIKTADTSKSWLISAPTMFLPHDVSNTRNAYHAFLAVLTLLEKYNDRAHASEQITTLVCPALCCGYGKMLSDVAASQMTDALHDFWVNGKRVDDTAHVSDTSVVLTRDKDTICDQQPNHYDNREIKHIDVKDIIFG